MKYLLLTLLFLSETVFASSGCTYKILLGSNNIILNETNIEQIDTYFGFAERFNFGEYGTAATCYNYDNQYLIFGFQSFESKLILARIEMSTLPPTGHEKSFCRKPQNKLKLSIDGEYIGRHINNHANSIYRNTNERILGKSDDGFSCILTTESIYFYGRLFYTANSISNSN